ncbi:XdhC/CoxI family protein [Streptomyces sp. AJS327]|uniref:XdhC family protein n=1 Tax=Streptomyces sp. AJS327 TaxID=2545265 RepID=UPI0015DE2805|nr:XdhC/CoxI family protein [Streptomyces sp. AJS327]MBA0052113.1 XdhC/CoxI family protein [Streptomyces sp. AJS327]
MLDIAQELDRWCARGRAFAVATVVGVGGSAPRQPGAALAVDAGGEAVGSVSGGCVEGAVYELCQESLRSGVSRVETFGYSDEDAFAVGLTCGGTIDILVTPVPADSPARAVLGRVLAASAAGSGIALVRPVDGPGVERDPESGPAPGPRPGTGDPPGAGPGREPSAPVPAVAATGALAVLPDGGWLGSLYGDPALDAEAAAEAAALLDLGRTGTVRVGWAGGAEPVAATGEPAPAECGELVTLFVECSVPPPRMLVFGAIDFAAALTRAGSFLGYRVTVCDARPVFATERRFPAADEVVVEWPHRYLDGQEVDGRTVICVLTHDAKFDIPLLERALRLPVGYVGAMGSRRTHEDRLDRLRAVGLTEAELARLHSPIGLDLGARTPEETAVSIVAEIVADRRGGSGVSLTGAHTPIHHEPDGRGPDAEATVPPVPGHRDGPAPAPAA